MDRHRIAFRRSLEKGTYSPGTIRHHVTASGRLLRFCRTTGYDLYAGEVPESLLDEFAEELEGSNGRRLLRGASLYLEFLAQRGVSLPQVSVPPLEPLEASEIAGFLNAAATQPDPYASVLLLLPFSGLSVRQLLVLTLDDIVREGGEIMIIVGSREARLGERGRAALTRYLDGWRAAYDGDSNLLFPNTSTGQAIAASTITRRLQLTQRAAGLHEFRSSALSALYERHFSPLLIDGPAEDEPSSGAQNGELAGTPELPTGDGTEPPSLEGEAITTGDSMDETSGAQENSMDHDDYDEFEDAPVSRSTKSKARRAPSRSYPSREVAKLLPRRGRVVIRKRRDNGALGWVGQYDVTDFGEDGAIEPFIERHLLPKWGPGDYLIYRNAHTDKPITAVHMLAPAGYEPRPPSTPQGYMSAPNPSEVLKDHLEAQKMLRDVGGGDPATVLDLATRLASMQGNAVAQQLGRLQHDIDEIKRGQSAFAMQPPSLAAGMPPAPESSFKDRMFEMMFQEFVSRRPMSDLDAVRRTKELMGEVQEMGGGSAAPEKTVLHSFLDFMGSSTAAELAKMLRPPTPVASPPPSPPLAAPPIPANEQQDQLPSDVPEGFESHAAGLAEAESEPDMLMKLVILFGRLNLEPEWQPHIQEALEPMVHDDREETLTRVWSILSALVRNGHLDELAARRAITGCRDHFQVIRGQVLELIRQRQAVPS